MRNLFFVSILLMVLCENCELIANVDRSKIDGNGNKHCLDIYTETPDCGCQIQSRKKFAGNYKGTLLITDANGGSLINNPNCNLTVLLGTNETEIYVSGFFSNNGPPAQTVHQFDWASLKNDPNSGIFNFIDGQIMGKYTIVSSNVSSDVLSKNGSLNFTVPKDFTVTTMNYEADGYVDGIKKYHFNFTGNKLP